MGQTSTKRVRKIYTCKWTHKRHRYHKIHQEITGIQRMKGYLQKLYLHHLTPKSRNPQSTNDSRCRSARLPIWRQLSQSIHDQWKTTYQQHHIGRTQRRPLPWHWYLQLLSWHKHAILSIHERPLIQDNPRNQRWIQLPNITIRSSLLGYM